MDKENPFLFVTNDGNIRSIQRYFNAGVRFVGHMGDQSILPEDMLNIVDFLDQTPAEDFFRPSVKVESACYLAKWDPSTPWRGFIPVVADPHRPGLGWMWALAEPAPYESYSSGGGWQLSQDAVKDWKEELELWPPIVATLKGLPHCPRDVPIPVVFPIADLEKVYPSQYELNLAAYRARCCVLEHLGWIVWYASLWEWKRGVAEYVNEVIEEFIDCLSDVRGFIIDFSTDWRNVNLWHLSICNIPFLVYNVEETRIGPKAAKFNVELIDAAQAFEAEHNTLAGFVPPTGFINAWVDAQKFDLLFRPRVEVPFYRAQHSQFIESRAVVTMVDAPGWRPHAVNKTTWVAFKYLYDYRVLPEKTGVNHKYPDSQQVEFSAWRHLVKWESYLQPGPARVKIGSSVQLMREKDGYPDDYLAREHYRWFCGPRRGYVYKNSGWVSDSGFDHFTLQSGDYNSTPLSSKSYIASRFLQTPSTVHQEDVIMKESTPGPSLAERISSAPSHDSGSGSRGKRDAPFESGQQQAPKRSRESPRSLRERLSNAGEESSEPNEESDQESSPPPNFSHMSSESEFEDAQNEYELVTLSDFVPTTERFLDMEYGIAAYRIPEGFSLDSESPHLRRRYEISPDAKIWERLPDTRRAAWNLIIWGFHCVPARPYLPSLMHEQQFSDVVAKFGYISMSDEQEAYLRYFALIHPEDQKVEGLLKHMIAHSIGFKIMYRVDEFKDIVPKLKAVTASQRHLAKSGRAYSTQSNRCVWSTGDRAMADDWKAKYFAILHTPHGSRCMIERGGNMAQILMLVDPEFVQSVFEGPSINVTRHLSGYTNSDTESECLLIGDELTQNEEEIVWGTMDPIPNDAVKNHVRWIWPSDKMTRQIMKDIWVSEIDNGPRDFAGIWHLVSDQVFRRIWKELTSNNPDEPTSRTEKGFRDLYRDYYRRFKGNRPYTPRRSDLDRAVEVVRDGWSRSWNEVKISALNIPEGLA